MPENTPHGTIETAHAVQYHVNRGRKGVHQTESVREGTVGQFIHSHPTLEQWLAR